MCTEENIAEAFAEILKELTNTDFEINPFLRGEKLLGEKIGLKARDLVVLLYRTEEVFEVSIPDDFICEGNFDTYDHILELLFQLLVKPIKERRETYEAGIEKT